MGVCVGMPIHHPWNAPCRIVMQGTALRYLWLQSNTNHDLHWNINITTTLSTWFELKKQCKPPTVFVNFGFVV